MDQLQHNLPAGRHNGRRGAAGLPLFLVFATVVLSTFGGIWWWKHDTRTNSATTKLVYTVSRNDFVLSVTERGEIQSADDVEIRCGVKAKKTTGTTILRLAPEGSHVEAGDFLVELDASGLEADNTTQQIAVSRSEALMIEAKNGYDTAVIAKKEYVQGTFVQEMQMIEGEIFVAEENQSRAKEYLVFSKRLAGKGHITEQQLEADRFAVEKTRKELEATQTKLRVLQKFTKLKMTTQLESDIRTAKAKWDAESKSYGLEQSKLKEIEDQIGRCNLTAPVAGVVMYAHATDRRGNDDFIVEPGAAVRERQVIIRLPNKEKMRVEMKINESLIKHVEAGARATISPIGLGEIVLYGTVSRVSEYSEPTGWRKANVKEYRAYVEIKEGNPLLRSGMTASVTIECQSFPDVLQVPVQSLYAHGDDAFCFVRKANGWEARRVRRGPTNENFFVIEDGLQAGEVVALNPRKLVDEVELPELPAEKTQQAVKPGKLPAREA